MSFVDEEESSYRTNDSDERPGEGGLETSIADYQSLLAQSPSDSYNIVVEEQDVALNKPVVVPDHLSLGHELLSDLKGNFFVVSLPGYFTNSAWRFMNIVGIAVSGAPLHILLGTTLFIAPVVFLLCAMMDCIRQVVVLYHSEEISFDAIQSLKFYFKSRGWETSLKLAFKFFLGVIGWTLGFEIASIKWPNNDLPSFFAHAIGAGVGTFSFLFLACEIVAISDRLRHKVAVIDHRAAVGVAQKGFWEGFVWSLQADLALYAYLRVSFGVDAFVQQVGSIHPLLRNPTLYFLLFICALVDAISVGIAGSTAFSLGCFISTPVGWLERRFVKWLHPKY